MRNADDDLVDRSSEKITPGSGISRCQEVKNPPLGGIIIILSSYHYHLIIFTPYHYHLIIFTPYHTDNHPYLKPMYTP